VPIDRLQHLLKTRHTRQVGGHRLNRAKLGEQSARRLGLGFALTYDHGTAVLLQYEAGRLQAHAAGADDDQ